MSIVSRNRPPFGEDGEAIIFVGEVATVGFRLTGANGAVQSYAGRTFGLQVYLDGGTNKINVNGALTSHADGDYIQCALTEDETDLLTAGTLYGWGFVEYTADGPIVACGGVVRAAAGATAAQASGAPGSGIGGITLYTLRIDTGIVTVTYMGAPGAGVLPGGTDGQFLVKNGASDYSTEWVTLGITHVSGLSASLSTLTAADVSLTSRLSTEEATRASADTSIVTRFSTADTSLATADASLTTRLSTEEATRGSADTSLTTATTSLTTRVSAEEAARASADTSLTTRISAEEAARASADTSIVTRFSTADASLATADTSLTTRLSTEEATRAAADTSLTTRLSTEEVTRSSAVSTVTVATTSLTTRVSTEEATRSSADTSLATAAAATYLPLAGGTLTGALAAVAGTAALPGLAVAGDLDTGIYGVSADVLGVSAGGVGVQTWAPGIATVAGVVRPDADATRDLGTVSARWRDGFLSRGLYVGSGGASTLPNGAGGSFSPQIGIQAASGVVGLSAGLIDGVNNRRAGLFVNDTAGVWGLSHTYSAGASPFVIWIGGNELLRLSTGGLLGLGIVPTSFLHVAGATGATLNTTYEPTGWAGLKGRVGMQYRGDGLVSSVNVRLTSLTAGTLDDPTQPGSALVLLSDGSLTLVDTTAGAGVRTFAPMFAVSGTGVTTLYNNVLAAVDATYDWGASGANRFRDGFLSRNLTVGGSINSANVTTTGAINAGTSVIAGATNGYQWTGRAILRSPADGSFRILNNAETISATLSVEAAATLALVNATNPQAFRVYNTTDGTNLERVSLDWSANIAYLRTQKGGTGADRSIVISATASTYIGGGGTFQWQFSSDGNFYPNADATTDAGGAAKQIRDLYLSRRLMIGGAAPAGASGLAAVQAFGNAWAMIGGDNLLDVTNKLGRWGTQHYTNTEEPLLAIYTQVTVGDANVNIGGGHSSGNAATQVGIWTAGSNTTPTGTQRWFWNSVGHYLAVADNTYDIGAAGATRARSIYAGTNVVIGNASTSTAQLHVGAGTALGLPNGAGTVLTPQVINSQTTGTAVVGAAVNDGTNNHRAGLFVDNTNGLWGLSARTAATAAPFIIYNNLAEQLRLDTSGRLGIGENNPSYLLDAKATSSGATVAGLRLNNNGTGANTRVSLAFQAAGTLYQSIIGGYGAASPEMQFNQLVGATGFWTWNSSGAEVMRLTGTGRLGILVNSPLGTLHVRTPTSEYEAARFDATDTAVFTSLAIAGTRFAYIGSASQVSDGGATTALAIRSDNILWFASGGSTRRWQMDTSGHFLAGADNTYDIGASGANRPRIAYIGTRVVAPTVTTTATTVASLPAAATAGAGGRAFVTDATATTYLSIVAGGGANAVPVVSNGTNWLIG